MLRKLRPSLNRRIDLVKDLLRRGSFDAELRAEPEAVLAGRLTTALQPGTSYGSIGGPGSISAQKVALSPSVAGSCHEIFGFTGSGLQPSLCVTIPAALLDQPAFEGGAASTLELTVCVEVATLVCIEVWTVDRNGEAVLYTDYQHIEAGCCYTWTFDLPFGDQTSAVEALAADLASVIAAVIQSATGVTLPEAEVTVQPDGDVLLQFPGSGAQFFGQGAYFATTICLPE